MDSVGDLERLARSFERHLRAENKSPKTVTTYGDSVAQLTQYLAGEGVTSGAEIRREHIAAFMEHLLGKRSAATASLRFRALQQFFRITAKGSHQAAFGYPRTTYCFASGLKRSPIPTVMKSLS